MMPEPFSRSTLLHKFLTPLFICSSVETLERADKMKQKGDGEIHIS
jgi:hypothetical protein